MKIKNLYTKLMTVVLLPLFLAGCLNDLFDQNDRTYQGDPVVEFFPLDAVVDEGAGNVTVNVQLIGEQRSSDLPISFIVDASSTAQSGTHYSSITSSPVTIPANSSITTVTVNVTGTGLNDGESVDLVLVLEGNQGEGVGAAEELKTYTLTIRGE